MRTAIAPTSHAPPCPLRRKRVQIATGESLPSKIELRLTVEQAARIFGAEGVLYNEQSTWSDLFRRPQEVQAIPAVASRSFFPKFRLCAMR